MDDFNDIRFALEKELLQEYILDKVFEKEVLESCEEDFITLDDELMPTVITDEDGNILFKFDESLVNGYSQEDYLNNEQLYLELVDLLDTLEGVSYLVIE